MNRHDLDALARHTAADLTRRGSLKALGSAGLAILAGSVAPASAKKNKKDDKKCKKQKDQCNDFFVPLCEDEDAPENCAEQTKVCCESLAKCHATTFLDCFFDLLNGSPE